MAGRNRKPIDLHLAEGNPSHLTKAEIEERKEQELNVPFTNVKAPSYLNKDQKKKFKDISDKLVKLGIMTELDVDCLARYILSQDLYILYTSKMSELIENNEIIALKDIQIMQDKAFRQAQASAGALGLTITSRCKIVIPALPDDDDDEL